MNVGIDAINAYTARCSLDVRELFAARGLNMARFDNLKMTRKSVAAPWEDPVTHAVNAARPLVDELGEDERNSIEMLIVATESGLDFGKSLANYVHDQLGLSRNCRCFEVKQACYGSTAALQMAAHYVAANGARAPRVLVVSTDVASDIHGHILISEGEHSSNFAEPSLGTGAVAMLVSAEPRVLALDLGASGLYSFEVMDTFRPLPGREAGDPDGSLLAYLDCLSKCVEHYRERVEAVDFGTDFEQLVFHTPFPGLVVSAHRQLLRRVLRWKAEVITRDFERRVASSLRFASEVGNLYSGSLYLGLCSALSASEQTEAYRVGMFAYGSGCAAEFFSGVVVPGAGLRVRARELDAVIEGRRALDLATYERFNELAKAIGFGVREAKPGPALAPELFAQHFEGQGLLVLDHIDGFHRHYRRA